MVINRAVSCDRLKKPGGCLINIIHPAFPFSSKKIGVQKPLKHGGDDIFFFFFSIAEFWELVSHDYLESARVVLIHEGTRLRRHSFKPDPMTIIT